MLNSQDDHLLYFQRELTYLRKMGQAFADKYPKIAGRLELGTEHCQDPNIERLIEAFAFLTARIQISIENEFPEVSSALLNVLYPHFMNPVPVMKLVEVISGVATSAEVAQTVFDTAQSWGKIAVHAKSTPGFIVNRVARPFYAEALRLYEEQVAEPATFDALLTQGAGFRMGPFALMDLIGNDVNYMVCKSVFDLFYQEPRFRPSILQLEQVNAGRLGRKSGRGWYDYGEGAKMPEPQTEAASDAPLIDGFDIAGCTVDGVLIQPTDGRTAAQVCRSAGQPVILCDHIDAGGSRLAFATSKDVPEVVIARLVATLADQAIQASRLPDWPGLVVLRTIAMLANEGFEAVLQGVTDEAGVDAAMRYGLNYPKGPIAWSREIGLSRVLSVLDAIHGLTGDPRYRASMALRFAAEA